MEIKAGASDNMNSTHNQSSSSHSFTEQALRAGLLGNMENVGRRGYFVGGGCSDVTEARIIREIEKRKIREDIVAAGASLLRQRELEEEVFKELTMEREIALRRGDRFSLLSSPFSSLQSYFQGSSLNWRDGFGHGERSVRWLEGVADGRLSLVNQLEGGADGRLSVVNQLGGGGFPFQQREPGATNGVGLKPVIDLRKGNTMSLVKPVHSSLAGVKRKFETPIAGGDNAAALATTSKKSQKWSCGLCQVSATSEQGLKDHLKGKKHNAKEKASLRNSKTFSDNSGDYLLPEETKQCGELSLPTGSTSLKLRNITDGNQDKNPKLKLIKGLGNVNAGSLAREEDNTFGSENSNSKFWCSMCKVGTTSEASMTTHRMGKKHVNLLQQNGGGVIAIKMMPFSIPSADVPIETAAKQGKLDSFAHAYKEVYGFGADWEADASEGEL